MKKHHYYLHGWNDNDTKVLVSFVCLLEDQLPLLGERVSNPEDASIWLIDVDSAQGRTFWQTANSGHETTRRANDAGRFKVALSHQPFTDTQWFIKNPLRVNGDTGFLTVLTKMLSAPLQAASPLSVSVPERRSTDSLFAKIANKENIELLFPEEIWILLDAQHEQCWSNRHPRQWIRFFPQLLTIQPASGTVFESLAMSSTPDCQAYPLDSIKWCAGLFLWKGEASPQAAQQQTYQLKNWPNFTHLPHHPKHLSLTNHLVRHPRTVDELIEDTKLSREFIQNYINACMTIDLLHANPSPAPAKPRKALGNHPLGGLLRKLGVSQ